MSRRFDLALLLWLALVGCGHREPQSRSTPSADAADTSRGDASTAGPSMDEPVDKESIAPLAWPDAIRTGRFQEAAESLQRLSPEQRAMSEVRLARARVSLAVGKPTETIAALDRLEDELPLLRDWIAKTRARAMFDAGPFEKAAEHYQSSSDVVSWVLAAEAWDKVGEATKARLAWDRVVAAPSRTRVQEERARFRRMSIVRLKHGDPAASDDARWLATNALDDKIWSQAAELLEKLTPPKLLTGNELLERARVLSGAMRSDAALRAIERAATRATTNGKVLSALELCRAKAEVFWKARTRYFEAGLTYRQCANMGGPRGAEHLFLAARAFSRADRDGDATAIFQSVIQRHPRTTWAEQAEFHLARTHALAGRWKEAAVAFDAYIKRWPDGKEKREAERYRALAYLMSHDNKKARKLLEDLSGGAEDAVAAARWTNLAALAALRDGDKLHALARWAEVARSRPLSYPALIARARLKEHGAELPPAIEPAEAGQSEPLVVELPPPADMLHRIGFDREAEEVLREREAAIVAKAPTRGTEALCTAYGMLDRGKRRYQLSLQIPGQRLATAPGEKNRVAWDCVYPRPYGDVVRRASSTARIAPDLVWSVMRQESAFDPDAVSPARAVGLMQILPETARATASAAKIPHDDARLTSPEQSITLGALYLRELLDKLGQNVALSVAAYNAGPEAIQRWLGRSKGATLDVFVEAIPFLETRGYVVRVLGNLARYGYMASGEEGVPSLPLELK